MPTWTKWQRKHLVIAERLNAGNSISQIMSEYKTAQQTIMRMREDA